jgi:hypothetical protein
MPRLIRERRLYHYSSYIQYTSSALVMLGICIRSVKRTRALAGELCLT